MSGFISRVGQFTDKNLRRVAAEFLATFTFVFFGVGATGAAVGAGLSLIEPIDGAGLMIIALAHGIGIALGYVVIGHISGGHMNPALTVATIVSGDTGVIRGVSYILGQLAGSTLAVFMVHEYLWSIGGLGVQIIGVNIGDGIALQVILSFFLSFTVFATAIDRPNSSLKAPLVIGVIIFLAHIIAIPLTGGSVNPARTFGPSLVHGNWDNHWVYWIGPIVGAIAGAVVYVVFFGTSQARDRLGTINVRTE